jgi:hypothetical protein
MAGTIKQRHRIYWDNTLGDMLCDPISKIAAIRYDKTRNNNSNISKNNI